MTTIKANQCIMFHCFIYCVLLEVSEEVVGGRVGAIFERESSSLHLFAIFTLFSHFLDRYAASSGNSYSNNKSTRIKNSQHTY